MEAAGKHLLLRLLVAKILDERGIRPMIFPGGTARAEDPGLSDAREASKAVPPGKRPPQWKSAAFFVKKRTIPKSYSS